MPARFEVNHAGIREFLLSGQLYPALEQKADPVLSRAKANASRHVDSGDYERSIHLERDRSDSRVRVRVVADDPKAAILESLYHVLGRAVG